MNQNFGPQNVRSPVSTAAKHGSQNALSVDVLTIFFPNEEIILNISSDLSAKNYTKEKDNIAL